MKEQTVSWHRGLTRSYSRGGRRKSAGGRKSLDRLGFQYLLPASCLLPPAFPPSSLHPVPSPRRRHGEPRALELEEAGEDGRRRKVERAHEVLGRETVLAAQCVEDAPGLRRQPGRRGGRAPSRPGHGADRREELREDVLGAAAEDRAVAQELVRARRRRREDRAGNREDVAAELGREARRDERARAPRRLDDDHSGGEPRDDAIAD